MSRIASLDLARGFTVLCITPVHAILLYSQPAVQSTLPGQLLGFIAEGPGAQLFLLCMGASYTYSRQQTFPQVMKRAWMLLAMGIALNAYKFSLPLLAGWMPLVLQQELELQSGWQGALQALGIGDILFPAAIALPILYGVRQCPHDRYLALLLAGGVALISPLVWDYHSTTDPIDYIVQLIGGHPPHVFFPLFPWLVYPLIGLAIAESLKKETVVTCFRAALVGVSLLALAFCLGDPWQGSFYRTGTIGTLYHVGIVLLTLYGWDVLHRFSKPNMGWRLLTYSSQNITQVYVVQWVVLFAGLPFIGYQAHGPIASFFLATGMTALVYFLSMLLNASRRTGLII